MKLEEMAKRFAARHHALVNQTRKYSGKPYIVHPATVAEIVRSVPHTEEMLAAAWLHDTVEDTEATLEEVRGIFGDTVAEFVEMLTDVSVPEDGNRATRKAIDREHTALAHPSAKTVKLADLIHNTHDIVNQDPEFAKVYIREKELLLEVLKEGDSTLHKQAQRMVDKFLDNE